MGYSAMPFLLEKRLVRIYILIFLYVLLHWVLVAVSRFSSGCVAWV